jgi:formate dehydrogenase subunit delta
MNAERLVTMANDIAHFFAADPDRQAALDGVVNHLKKFWEPRMRKQIVAHVRTHGTDGLHDLARDAVAKLAESEAVA